jgi:hypothetical protein
VNPQLDIINCAWTQKNDERRDQPRGEAAKDREPVIDPADQEIPGAKKDQISGDRPRAGKALAEALVASLRPDRDQRNHRKSWRERQDAR